MMGTVPLPSCLLLGKFRCPFDCVDSVTFPRLGLSNGAGFPVTTLIVSTGTPITRESSIAAKSHASSIVDASAVKCVSTPELCD